jgi:hypothetical protein
LNVEDEGDFDEQPIRVPLARKPIDFRNGNDAI